MALYILLGRGKSWFNMFCNMLIIFVSWPIEVVPLMFKSSKMKLFQHRGNMGLKWDPLTTNSIAFWVRYRSPSRVGWQRAHSKSWITGPFPPRWDTLLYQLSLINDYLLHWNYMPVELENPQTAEMFLRDAVPSRKGASHISWDSAPRINKSVVFALNTAACYFILHSFIFRVTQVPSSWVLRKIIANYH